MEIICWKEGLLGGSASQQEVISLLNKSGISVGIGGLSFSKAIASQSSLLKKLIKKNDF